MAGPVEAESHDDILFVRVEGDLDIATADGLRDGCLAAMTNHCVGLVLDLSATGYVDSAGIRALFAMSDRLEPHRQRLALVVPPGAHIRRALAVVDMESGASLDETADAAFARLRAPARGRPAGP